MCAKKTTEQHGVALVLVLGVLTVMVIMAVAFSISMRTERMAASNYSDIVKARQLVYVGLARAMEHIQADMRTNLSHTGAQVYPAWSVTNAYTTNTSDNVSNLTGEAGNFVPRALWADAVSADGTDRTNHWLEIRHNVYTNVTTNGPDDIETNVVSFLAGRVTYMIINCSGLLDANYVGGTNGGSLIPRDLGINPNEIAIAKLYEIGGASEDPTEFLNNRQTYVRYETLHELAELDGRPTNLFIYSYFPAGYWTNDAMGGGGISTGVCIVGLNETELPLIKPDITNAFWQAGFTNAGETDLLFNNLIDYVDANIVPQNIQQACVEPVPMINEIVFQSKKSQDPNPPNDYFVTNTVSFELWYPFVSGAETFSFTGSVNFVSSLPATISAGGVETNITVSPSSPFAFVSFTNTAQLPGDPGSFTPILITAQVTYGADPVDELNPSILMGVSVMSDGSEVALECLDPRFNWDSSQWRTAASPTLMNSNIWTINYLATTPDSDGDTAMYVADAPLKSVGELGYLVYAPWKTVKLYGTNAHRVLDTFTMSTNASRRGLVNPNSKVTNVLAAVFADMPMNEYPEQAGATTIDWSKALVLATNMIENVSYTNLSDVGRTGWWTNYFDSVYFNPSVTNELTRESFIRNTAGLFSTRQNLFVILVEAQTGRGDFIPSNPAKQRVAALVWRDPFTGECFVRSIKWLGD